MKTLTEREIAAALETRPAWTLEGGVLEWQRRFPNFSAAFAFLTRAASLAEEADHHPDILHPDIVLEYDRLTPRLLSHDAGGMTQRDLNLAAAISALDER